jgi:hypothetical protein
MRSPIFPRGSSLAIGGRKMSPAEKLQLADLPVAVMMIAAGVAFLSLRKKMSASRAERVAKGEITAAQALTADRIVLWSGWSVTACGVFLLGMWATGY